MRSQLLCTFTTVLDIPTCIEQIHNTYNIESITNMKCYQYESDTPAICTYNTTDTQSRMSHTITINRKKETETLYSINALNTLIKNLNNGVLDKSYRVDWTQYTNQLLLVDRDGSFRVIKIKLL